MMSWACESDARRFGQRVTTRYGDEGDAIAVAIATADRKAGGNRALSVARRALVVTLAGDRACVYRGHRRWRQGAARRQRSAGGGALAALALVIGVSVAALRG